MTVIYFLVSSHFTSIYNYAKFSCRSVTTDSHKDNARFFDLKGIAILNSNKIYILFNHW